MNYITTQNARRALRIGAAVLALVIACTLLTAELAYDCGRLLRLAIHDRSEQLAAVHLRVLGLEAPGPRPAPLGHGIPEPCPAAPAAPLPVASTVLAACAAPSPAAGRQAPALEGMTTVQLRKLAQQRGHRNIGGTRTSKAKRQALLEALA